MDQPHQRTNMPLKKNPSLVPPSPFSHHPCLTPFTRTSQTQNNFLDSLTPIHLLWIRLCSQILIKTTLVKVTNDLCVAKSNADCGPHLVWPIRIYLTIPVSLSVLAFSTAHSLVPLSPLWPPLVPHWFLLISLLWISGCPRLSLWTSFAFCLLFQTRWSYAPSGPSIPFTCRYWTPSRTSPSIPN